MSWGKRSGDDRKEIEDAERRTRVAALYLSGKTQHETAKEVGCSSSTVHRDLEYLRKEWIERSMFDMNQKKAEELAKLDRVEREAWDAWERSKEKAESKTVRTREITVDQNEMETTIRVEGRDGDPRFLAIIQGCVNKRTEMLGLNTGLELKLSGKVEIDALRNDLVRRLSRIAASERETEVSGDVDG